VTLEPIGTFQRHFKNASHEAPKENQEKSKSRNLLPFSAAADLFPYAKVLQKLLHLIIYWDYDIRLFKYLFHFENLLCLVE
jgi:hypothetical protein